MKLLIATGVLLAAAVAYTDGLVQRYERQKHETNCNQLVDTQDRNK